MTSEPTFLNDHLTLPVVFIGLMGAGKTEIGQRLARTLGLTFYDSDDEIVRREGRSIAEIFEKEGEGYFRKSEKEVIRDLLDRPKAVISLGGGAVMQPETAGLIWDKSVSIFLNAPVNVLVERVMQGGEIRPLLEGTDPEQTLQGLLSVREPEYKKAMFEVDSAGPADMVVKDIIRILTQYLERQSI